MNDTIYRQEAIEAMEGLPKYFDKTDTLCLDYADVLAVLSEHLPSAQPEIIRCKDCKHRPIATRADEGILWGFSVEFPDERCPLQCEDGWYNHYPKDDFYCANAERRTDE